jgi:hypothetical protein
MPALRGGFRAAGDCVSASRSPNHGDRESLKAIYGPQTFTAWLPM